MVRPLSDRKRLVQRAIIIFQTVTVIFVRTNLVQETRINLTVPSFRLSSDKHLIAALLTSGHGSIAVEFY